MADRTCGPHQHCRASKQCSAPNGPVAGVPARIAQAQASCLPRYSSQTSQRVSPDAYGHCASGSGLQRPALARLAIPHPGPGGHQLPQRSTQPHLHQTQSARRSSSKCSHPQPHRQQRCLRQMHQPRSRQVGHPRLPGGNPQRPQQALSQGRQLSSQGPLGQQATSRLTTPLTLTSSRQGAQCRLCRARVGLCG